jgi:hypothetical protein
MDINGAIPSVSKNSFQDLFFQTREFTAEYSVFREVCNLLASFCPKKKTGLNFTICSFMNYLAKISIKYLIEIEILNE